MGSLSRHHPSFRNHKIGSGNLSRPAISVLYRGSLQCALRAMPARLLGTGSHCLTKTFPSTMLGLTCFRTRCSKINSPLIGVRFEGFQEASAPASGQLKHYSCKCLFAVARRRDPRSNTKRILVGATLVSTPMTAKSLNRYSRDNSVI